MNSNWQAAIDARDLETLRMIIQIVTEHERMFWRVISAIELRQALEGQKKV